jgi:hypothetical protein
LYSARYVQQCTPAAAPHAKTKEPKFWNGSINHPLNFYCRSSALREPFCRSLNIMTVINVPNEYGYVFLVAVAFWVQQAVIFSIPVGLQRNKTGIKAPVMYPNDKLIANLKLSEHQVEEYMRAQRVHQNNVEFLCMYFPIFLLSALENPTHAAAAGALVWLGRMVVALGYWKSVSARAYGAW